MFSKHLFCTITMAFMERRFNEMYDKESISPQKKLELFPSAHEWILTIQI